MSRNRNPRPLTDRDKIRAIVKQYVPQASDGTLYESTPLVVVPTSLHPKGEQGRRLAQAHDDYLDAVTLDDQADDALDAACSDFKARDEYRAKATALAARLASGEASSDDLASVLPVYSDEQMLSVVEIRAQARGFARTTRKARARAYDDLVAEIGPDLVPAAVAVAEREEAAAVKAEAAASVARAKATSARNLTWDLRLPEAFRACQKAGVGHSEGRSVLDRARLLRGFALISPLEGWSNDRDRYTWHPKYLDAAGHLGVSFVAVGPDPRADAEAAARRRMDVREGKFVAEGRTTWTAP